MSRAIASVAALSVSLSAAVAAGRESIAVPAPTSVTSIAPASVRSIALASDSRIAPTSVRQAPTSSPTPSQEDAQGRGGRAGGRGGRQGGPAGRANAPIDLTGLWVSVVTEDWRWRMRTPPKGDYASLPLTPEARKVADSWDPARDTAAGEQCRAYGAAAIMRVPGRVRISWENDSTLKVETEAGTQTRRFLFGAPPAAAAPGWQGTSVAVWQPAGRGGRNAAQARGGSLRVTTTNMRPGYLRKNGVPYSANAELTEYYNVVEGPNGDTWLIVTTMVEDPEYLQQRFVTSTHFKKVTDGTAWTPAPCTAT